MVALSRRKRTVSFMLYEIAYGPIVFVHSVYRQLLVLLAMFTLGAIVFSYYEGLPPLAAILASVSTITTIGLYVPHGGNFLSMYWGESLSLIILIIISVGAGASILQNTVNSIVNGDLARGEVEKKLIGKLKHHAIVFGYSQIGKYVVEKLEQLGLDYVVVTDERNEYEELLSRHKLAILERGRETISALDEAEVSRATVVIITCSDDSYNMLVALSARKLRSDLRIISVVSNPSHMESARNAGVDHVISSSITIGHLLAFSAVTEDLVGVLFSDKYPAKEISEVKVSSSSKLVGGNLKSFLHGDLALIAIIREGRRITNFFDPTFEILAGDTLLLIGTPQELQRLSDGSRE